MSENLLQFIWMHRLYASHLQLQTLDGYAINIVHPGVLNKNAGPDFLEAKIRIADTLWVGNVELHIKSSDWHKHAHQEDERYTKLILHVVYEYDIPIVTKDGATFPTLVLQPFIDSKLLARHTHLMETKRWIPCGDQIKQVSAINIHQQLTRALTERLENKMHACTQLLTQLNNNWQEVFYIQLARGFGLHINQDVFEQLALRTPLSLIAKLKNNSLKVEALLFGQAGFLFDYFDEPYPLALQKEYVYLQKAYRLSPLTKHQWKFLRLRPANFPTLRIAQFVRLISTSTHLFSKLMESVAIKEMEILLSLKLEGYWTNHYNFDEVSVTRSKSLGKAFVQTLIINVVIPMMFIYGKLQGNESYCDKAILFLEQLPPERNVILDAWKEIGLAISSAADTQALLQLKSKYCDAKQCLKCSIGYALLSKSEDELNT